MEAKSARDQSPRVADLFIAALAAACSIPLERNGCREAKQQVRPALCMVRCVPHQDSSPLQEGLFFSSRVEGWCPPALVAAGLVFAGCAFPANS